MFISGSTFFGKSRRDRPFKRFRQAASRRVSGDVARLRALDRLSQLDQGSLL